MLGVVCIFVALLQFSFAVSNTIDYANSTPVELLQEYLRINTTTHNDLTDAVEFWKALAEVANVPISVYEFVKGYPVIVMKWAGTDSSLNSIMLNSHMDVVPAALEDGWTYEPFSGHIDDNGVIYGRGAQDMKSVSIQHYEALRRLKEKNLCLTRDIYMTLMPDEEVGAENGMIPFLQSPEFAAMHVAVELDEGSSFNVPMIPAFYQDKVVWQIRVDCFGISGHGSSFPETNTTAIGKCRNVIDRFFAFRDEQHKLSLNSDPSDAGGYTSVNANIIGGGTANNVIPSHVSVIFDIRLSVTLNEDEFNATLHKWIAEAGDNITLTYILQNQQSPATIANSTNPFWTAISNAAKEVGVIIAPTRPPGSTDARHVRNAGFPAFGLSPMPNTELLLHAVNEHLSTDIFMDGIDLFEKIIFNLANVPGEETSSDSSVYLYKTAV